MNQRTRELFFSVIGQHVNGVYHSTLSDTHRVRHD